MLLGGFAKKNGVPDSGLEFQWVMVKSSGGYIYLPAGSASSFSASNPGTYTLRLLVHDPISGCSNSTDIAVIVRELPDLSGFTDQQICHGSNVLLHIPTVGTFTNTWSHSNANVTGTVVGKDYSLTNLTEATSVTLIQEDGFGCIASKTIEVTPKAPLITSMQDKISVCYGSGITLNADLVPNATGNWSPYTYTNCDQTIDCNPVLVEEALPVGKTKFTISVNSDDGCTQQRVLEVTVHPRPDVTIPSPIVACKGTPLVFTLADNSTNDILTWGSTNPSNHQPIFKTSTTADYGLVTGDFTVTLSRKNNITGCFNSGISLVKYKEIIVSAEAKYEVCINKEIDLKLTANSTDYTVVWSTANTSITLYTRSNGTYYVKGQELPLGNTVFTYIVTDNATGCKQAGSIT